MLLETALVEAGTENLRTSGAGLPPGSPRTRGRNVGFLFVGGKAGRRLSTCKGRGSIALAAAEDPYVEGQGVAARPSSRWKNAQQDTAAEGPPRAHAPFGS